MATRLLPSPLRLLRLSTPPTRPATTLLLATARQPPRPAPYLSLRQKHTIPRPRPSTPTPSLPAPSSQPAEAPAAAEQPPPRDEYELTFTCTPCTHRSSHRISKHGYHKGSVLVTCPSCRNRHVISDHLGIFGKDVRPGGWTIEDLLRERGEGVKRGRLQAAVEGGAEEDLEFWDDGSVTVRDRDEVKRRLKWERQGEVDDGAVPGSSFKSVRPGDKPAEE